MSGLLPAKFKPTKNCVFVVGNGPSLKGFDFNQLNDRYWVGMNAAYRHWEQIGCYPTFYVCLDLVVGLSHKNNIERLVENAETLGIQAFLLRENLISKSEILSSSQRVQNFDHIFGSLPQRVFELVTTGSHAIIWMESLGFNEMVLLGIDANYEEVVPGARSLSGTVLEIGKQTSNPNYYFEDYQREGDHYTLPNPQAHVHLGAWRRCAQYLKQKRPDIKILNGSPSSEIDSFPFISLKSSFESGAEVVTVEEQLSLKNSRSLEVRKTNKEFDLAVFLNALSPLHVGQYEVQGAQSPDISGLKQYGWSKFSESNSDRRRLVTSFSKIIPDEAAISLTCFQKGDAAKIICDQLLERNDTVLVLSDMEESICLKRYPCKLEDEIGCLIAFRSLRFWNQELKEALSLGVSKNKPRFPLKAKFARRLRTLFSKLKHNRLRS